MDKNYNLKHESGVFIRTTEPLTVLCQYIFTRCLKPATKSCSWNGRLLLLCEEHWRDMGF